LQGYNKLSTESTGKINEYTRVNRVKFGLCLKQTFFSSPELDELKKELNLK